MLLDGVDVRELASGDLRRHVGVVLQEPFLFRGTICDNLIYGRPEATAEEAITAARAAQAHDFILHKPLGYDTWLGERGAGLSGGERQRVSIARALLYDPKVLILDEATSSVDTESEKAIQEALQVLTRGRTTLAIAHRLSTLRDSDRIFVFDQGRLIEQGTHDELMRLDGKYARLVKIQTQIARNTQFECALNDAADETPGEPEPDAGTDLAEADFAPLWFEPDTVTLSEGRYGTLEVDAARRHGPPQRLCRPLLSGHPARGLHQPAHLGPDGQDHELGIVRNLDRWSTRQPGADPFVTGPPLLPATDRRGSTDITLEYGHLRLRRPHRPGPDRSSPCAGLRARPRTSASAARCCSTSRTIASWFPTSTPCRPRNASCSRGMCTGEREEAGFAAARLDAHPPFGHPLPLASGRGRFMPSPGTPGEGGRQAG